MSVSLRRRTRGVGRCWRPASASAQAWRQTPLVRRMIRRASGLARAICWSCTGDTPQSPLTPNDIPLGAGQVMAWPMDPAGNVVRDGSRLNKVLLVRLDPAVLDPQTEERAADGVVAYSAICPHTGCEVINWSADRQHSRVSVPQLVNMTPRRVRGSIGWSIAARPCGAAAARSGRQTDGRAAVHRSTGYSTGLGFGEPIDSGQRDAANWCLTKQQWGKPNVRQTKHVARHHGRRPDAGAARFIRARAGRADGAAVAAGRARPDAAEWRAGRRAAASGAGPGQLQGGDRRSVEAAGGQRLADVPPHL